MYSYEVISLGMTIRSVLIAWIRDLICSIKWPLNVSCADICCFVNNILSLLIRTTCIQCLISSFSHSLPRLTYGYSPHGHLHLRHTYFFSSLSHMVVVLCCLPALPASHSLASFPCLMFLWQWVFHLHHQWVIGLCIELYWHFISITLKCV
jgi:hypothetical protein